MEIKRHEEEPLVGRTTEEAGRLGVKKAVESGRAAEDVAKLAEHASVERAPAAEGDSGEIEVLPDGSVSIPVFEEELVVTKRTVVRERVIVRKDLVTDHERVEVDVRRERVELETSGEVELADDEG
jgi:uncharacterized protein (TIGR02271 family)